MFNFRYWSFFTSTNADYATVKINPKGILQWATRYENPQNLDEYSRCIAVDSNGNVIVTGQARNDTVSYDYDYLTIKYDSLGAELWKSRYVNSGTETFKTSMAIDHNGNIYVAAIAEKMEFINMD